MHLDLTRNIPLRHATPGRCIRSKIAVLACLLILGVAAPASAQQGPWVGTITAQTVPVQAKPFDHSTVRREVHAGDIVGVMGEAAGMEGDGKTWWVTTEGYIPQGAVQPADDSLKDAWTLPSADEAASGWWGELVERARVRTAASVDAPVVGFLQPGDRVKVLGEQEGEPIDGDAVWYRVDGGRYAGGLVHGSTVARIAAPSPGVPAAEIGPGQAIVISLGQKSLSLVHGEDATFTTYVALGGCIERRPAWTICPAIAIRTPRNRTRSPMSRGRSTSRKVATRSTALTGMTRSEPIRARAA